MSRRLYNTVKKTHVTVILFIKLASAASSVTGVLTLVSRKTVAVFLASCILWHLSRDWFVQSLHFGGELATNTLTQGEHTTPHSNMQWQRWWQRCVCVRVCSANQWAAYCPEAKEGDRYRRVIMRRALWVLWRRWRKGWINDPRVENCVRDGVKAVDGNVGTKGCHAVENCQHTGGRIWRHLLNQS